MKYKIGFNVMSLSEFTNHSYFNWFFFFNREEEYLGILRRVNLILFQIKRMIQG